VSAVPESLFIASNATAGRPAARSRHDPGLARRAPGEADRLEALILRHCGGQIGAAAGRGASVVDLGGAASPSTALLRSALARNGSESGSARKRVFVLPPGRMGCAGPVEAARLLRALGERCGDDALLVVGAALPSSGAALAGLDSDAVQPAESARPLPATHHRYSLARFARLAADTGWQHSQFWSDGQARYAVHVLERIRCSLGAAHVTET